MHRHTCTQTNDKLRTLRMKLSSGCRRRLCTAFLISVSRSTFCLRGTLRAGNRSPMRPMKTGKSSVTILGVLKSRSARINTCKPTWTYILYTRRYWYCKKKQPYRWYNINVKLNDTYMPKRQSINIWYNTYVKLKSISHWYNTNDQS